MNLLEAYNYLPGAVAVFDKDMRYLAFSQKWLTDYGLDESIRGKSHYEVFPEIGEDWKSIHRECLEGKIHQRALDRFVRADGHVQWLRWQINPWKIDGQIAGIIISSEDISELKSVQDKLENSELLFGKFMENIPVLIWMKDAELRYTYVNEYFKEKLKVKDHEIIGKKDDDIMETENAKFCLQSDMDALTADGPVTSIERSFDPNSFYKFILTIKFRIATSDGTYILGAIGIDITGVKNDL